MGNVHFGGEAISSISVAQIESQDTYMIQAEFVALLDGSKRALQEWEQGWCAASGAVQTVLWVAESIWKRCRS
ncbi:XRE family transcriptional regulator [Chromobacterium sp. Beijing]|nr:XRE family transcriptional regulator [Chromobacterium sp. Beijing]